MSDRILIIEDDLEIGELLEEFLTDAGLETVVCRLGDEGLTQALSQTFSTILLDIMLPGMDGLDVLRELRKECTTPVLMLTAKGDDIDRIIGLELGADDYLPKPFNPRELLARIKALLRRVALDQKRVTSDNKPEPVLKAGTLSIDLNRHEVCHGDTVLNLTSTEFDTLIVLVRQMGQLVSRDRLTRDVLHRPLSAHDRAIDMHVSNLRRKLANALNDELSLKTIRGQGYLLEPLA